MDSEEPNQTARAISPTITRIFRTSSSDQFIIFDKSDRICHITAHYEEVIHVDVMFERRYKDKFIEDIIQLVYNLVDVSGVKDRLVNVYIGKEYISLSDSVDQSEMPASRSDVLKLENNWAKLSGRYKFSIGKLVENMTKDYFQKLGYNVRGATKAEDHNKIDVVAENDQEVILVQCKSGNLSESTIKSYCSKMLSSVTQENKELVLCFVSKSFPSKLVIEPSLIGGKFGCKIIYIRISDLLREFPDANQVLSDH